ncbi:MAG: hypothetical protein M0P59_03405 [Gallionella sp.]|jgi:pyrimidine deaminase RibD-like protein|nr:hypothetical protein [Gallionella sp.]MCK9353186.1 hypothetical protein [Gallionella sp.]
MECWYPTEDPEARAIVATHNQESIQSAVAAIKLRPNSAGKKTSPVPALVKAELDHMSQVAIAQQEAQYLAEVTSKVKLNPAAQAVGEQILDKARKKLSAKHLQVGT